MFSDVKDLLVELEVNKAESYSLYWKGADDPHIDDTMLFFTKDGYMVAGLAVDEEYVNRYFNTLVQLVDGQYGYITIAGPPPETKEEFVEICRDSNQLRMIGEQVIGCAIT